MAATARIPRSALPMVPNAIMDTLQGICDIYLSFNDSDLPEGWVRDSKGSPMGLTRQALIAGLALLPGLTRRDAVNIAAGCKINGETVAYNYLLWTDGQLGDNQLDGNQANGNRRDSGVELQIDDGQ